jgi:hypothetical protein
VSSFDQLALLVATLRDSWRIDTSCNGELFIRIDIAYGFVMGYDNYGAMVLLILAVFGNRLLASVIRLATTTL